MHPVIDERNSVYRSGGAAAENPDERLSMAEETYRELKRRIIYNEMPPGFQALEKEVQLTLGVSRTPLREALVRLQDEGLVELIPRRGVRVRQLSAQDILDIEELLACLEVEAVGKLAARHPAPEVVAELLDAIEQMDRALNEEDMIAWAEADHEFHRKIVGLSGNGQLTIVAQNFLEKAHRFRMLFLPVRGRPVYSNVNHASVVEAIRRGDAESARQLHRGHKHRISTEIADWIRALGIEE